MNRGIWTAASGGMATQARLDQVAQNLANLSTVGYKAGRLTFELKPLDGGPRGSIDPVLGKTSAHVVQSATVTDFSQGPIQQTGNPLEVAIVGQGFFAVATPRGERYTRQGTFALDADGYLTTAQGERVQGDQTDLQIGTGPVEIGEDGSIRRDGNTIGRIKLVDFGDDPKLVPEGNALFAPAPGATGAPLDASRTRVQQGAVEASNVSAVSGLVELVDVSRSYESYMRTMQRLDDIASKSITDLGRV